MDEARVEVDTQPMSSAGALLRAARRGKGMDVATLAAALKVSTRKLESLENDNYDDLQGVAFVRALAQAACRALRIDPAPVLARLPQTNSVALDSVNAGLNAPFRERALRVDSAQIFNGSRSVFLLAALLLGATLVLFFAPPGFWIEHLKLPDWLSSTVDAGTAAVRHVVESPPERAPATAPPALAPASEPVVSAASPSPDASQGSSASAETKTAVSAADALSTPADTVSAAMPANVPLVIKVSAPSWIEVIDANGESLIGRTVNPGESVGLDGATPLHVKIGNAKDTELTFKGQPVDLVPQTRDNVARLQLK
jgi:cytoskeleton protein RodZ